VNLPAIFFVIGSVVEHYGFETAIAPYRGLAFRSPLSGEWCSLRTGCVLASYVGDEFHVHFSKPVRQAWQPGLQARFPRWVMSRHTTQQSREVAA
jgi:hypothetical protein